ncbi:hypothetical protein [Sideroxydans sp. CL21]|uniref:hypothetical protein n=1 Tax=Sideroxydans sp. CL21 TaxID=2600596 RepID=UPI0024BCFDF8|nr:hypothetical protein [Sideroxydans sp. CL21]
MAKIILATAIILSFIRFAVAEESTPSSTSLDFNTIVIEVLGEVPGLTQEQLVSYLIKKMQAATDTHWHSVAVKPGEADSPNRVVWTFKTLRKVVWKGGSHKGFQSPAHSETYLRAEAKLYFMGVYQMTMDTHPSVSSDDYQFLSEMAHNAAHAMFVENKPDIQ